MLLKLERKKSYLLKLKDLKLPLWWIDENNIENFDFDSKNPLVNISVEDNSRGMIGVKKLTIIQYLFF